jgi:hypothetical protein
MSAKRGDEETCKDNFLKIWDEPLLDFSEDVCHTALEERILFLWLTVSSSIEWMLLFVFLSIKSQQWWQKEHHEMKKLRLRLCIPHVLKNSANEGDKWMDFMRWMFTGNVTHVTGVDSLDCYRWTWLMFAVKQLRPEKEGTLWLLDLSKALIFLETLMMQV